MYSIAPVPPGTGQQSVTALPGTEEHPERFHHRLGSISNSSTMHWTDHYSFTMHWRASLAVHCELEESFTVLPGTGKQQQWLHHELESIMNHLNWTASDPLWIWQPQFYCELNSNSNNSTMNWKASFMVYTVNWGASVTVPSWTGQHHF